MALHDRTRLLNARSTGAPPPDSPAKPPFRRLPAAEARRWPGVIAALLLSAAPLVAAASAAGAPAAPQAREAEGAASLDRVVAVVNGEPITLSEVVEALALDPGAAPPPTHEGALERLIDARLMEREARRYPLEAPSEEEIEATLGALRDRFSSPDAYRTTLLRLGIAEDYLRKRIRRELVVDRYLDHRFRPLVQVTQRQVEDYYRTVLLPVLDAGSTAAFGEVESLIRGILLERDLNRRIDEWVDELKSAARIVRLPLAEPPPAG